MSQGLPRSLDAIGEGVKRCNPHLFGAQGAKDTGAAEQRPQLRPSLEADLHEMVADYCRSRGWYFVHSRLDRRTTTALGVPDYLIFKPLGVVLCLELKRPKGKPTPPQLAAQAHLRRLGHVSEVVDNWLDALKWLEK